MTTTPDLPASFGLPTATRTESVAEREERGRQARVARPRTSLAQWSPGANRPDPVALLQGQETVRVQALLPLRHSRMAVSPFTFYRGSAVVMANDLAELPTSGLITQLCGDAHLSNFGLFAAPDRSVVFDINDFDETNPGPFEWDVFRMATSFVLAGRDVGVHAAAIEAAATEAASAYRKQMQAYALMPELEIWYDRISIEVLQQWAKQEGLTQAEKRIEKGAEKARTRDAWSAISKMTEVVDGRRQFLNEPPLLMRIDLDADARAAIKELLGAYLDTTPPAPRQLLRRYRMLDFAHKVVGVGSVGLLAFVVLLEGRDENDMLVLQVKQAVGSVLEPFTAPSVFEYSGERVVVGQQLMQAASDAFLGWIRGPHDRDFYIRQLRDMKYSVDPSKFTAQTLSTYATVCGRTLARAHARSGDAVAIGAYLGTSEKFEKAVRDFTLAYADQVDADYAEFTKAIASGSVSVERPGVTPTYTVSADVKSGFTVTSGVADTPGPESS